MIYFLFHNQKTNKIFYHLLGRLDVFLFISSLSGSIKFPLNFSFYNTRDRNSVFFILYIKKKNIFFSLRIFFFLVLYPQAAAVDLFGGGRGLRKEGQKATCLLKYVDAGRGFE